MLHQVDPIINKVPALFEYQRHPETHKPTGKVFFDQLDACFATQLQKSSSTLAFIVTGKVDGTCCFIKNGKLWARQDLRGTPGAPLSSFKTKRPDGWHIMDPAVKTLEEENACKADEGGHLVGFRPIHPKTDKWHADALVNETHVRRYAWVVDRLVLQEVALVALDGLSVELVGPKINGNVHQLPQHGIIIHGDILCSNLEEICQQKHWQNISQDIINYLTTDSLGKALEGIVVYSIEQGQAWKLHRDHLNLVPNKPTLPLPR